ncbi:MAG: PSP1 family protein [Amphiamblys sp. WSBS2006]|nr:MAG: PSP1 family protein [Amphiamblys sp. WSBS2006]
MKKRRGAGPGEIGLGFENRDNGKDGGGFDEQRKSESVPHPFLNAIIKGIENDISKDRQLAGTRQTGSQRKDNEAPPPEACLKEKEGGTATMALQSGFIGEGCEKHDFKRHESFCDDSGCLEATHDIWRVIGGPGPRKQEADRALFSSGNEFFERRRNMSFETLCNFPDPLLDVKKEYGAIREKRERSKSMSFLNMGEYFQQREDLFDMRKREKIEEVYEGSSDCENSDTNPKEGGDTEPQPQTKTEIVAEKRLGGFSMSSYSGDFYIVVFKAGRFDVFYAGGLEKEPSEGMNVYVEADRGIDMGKVVKRFDQEKIKKALESGKAGESSIDETMLCADNFNEEQFVQMFGRNEVQPKRIHSQAPEGELKKMKEKEDDETVAIVKCQGKIREKKLPMSVIDAEYQWDRKKLTFFFISERRIDFRELVRDLFRVYKTRIWMCAVDRRRLPVCSADGRTPRKNVSQ